MAADPKVLAYLRKAAIARNIDPDIAVKAFGHEALNVFDPNKPDRGGDHGSSFGVAQLHYGGLSKVEPNPGLGDAFTKATGLDARDPSTWPQQIDFALDHVAKNGWGAWMGAKAEGITGMMGVGGRGGGGQYNLKQTRITPATGSAPAGDVGGLGRGSIMAAQQRGDAAGDGTTVAGGGYTLPPLPSAEQRPETGAESLKGGFKDIANVYGDAIQQPRPLNTPMNADMGGGSPMPSFFRPQLAPTSLAAGSGQMGGMGGGTDMRQLLAMLMQQQGGYA
jgi:hypothetical protein